MKIKHKLLLSFPALSILPIIALGAAMAVVLSNSLGVAREDAVREQLGAVVGAGLHETRDAVQNYTSFLAADSALVKSAYYAVSVGSADDVNTVLKQMADRLELSTLEVADPQGKIIASLQSGRVGKSLDAKLVNLANQPKPGTSTLSDEAGLISVSSAALIKRSDSSIAILHGARALNAAVVKTIAGHTPALVVSSNGTGLVDPHGLAVQATVLEEAVKASAQGCTAQDCELAGYLAQSTPVKLKDGAEESVTLATAAIRNESGQPVGLLGIAKETSAARAAMKQALLVVVGLGALIGAAGVLFGLTVMRSITKPLSGLVSALHDLAQGEGDLSRRLPVGHDEIGQASALVNAFMLKLEGIVRKVREGADQISMASAEVSSGNADLSARTETQASSLQQTAASMEQLGTTVRQNADNASEANRLAAAASNVARQGGEVVGQVVQTMRGISESSRRISDITAVIDGIAFQTNILALNAAVEAARAGEQGRGFAVVASEVRSLAQRSAEAAKEIKSLIVSSSERVEAGTMLVDNAGATMTEVVQSIERVTQIISEISTASAEQSAGVSQVGQAVTQMDQSTQQNAALVEQSAAAAESLSQLSRQMVATLAAFKLSEGVAA
jgi:methyl-accepting chemotaxis protein